MGIVGKVSAAGGSSRLLAAGKRVAVNLLFALRRARRYLREGDMPAYLRRPDDVPSLRRALGLPAEWVAPAAALPETRGGAAMVPHAACVLIIYAHGPLGLIRRCLEQVSPPAPPDYRVVIIDDGADAHTASFLHAFTAGHAGIQLLRFDKTRGPLAAFNAAMAAHAEPGADVLLLDGRGLPSPRLRELLARSAHGDAETGLATPLSNMATDVWLRARPGDSFRDTGRMLAGMGFEYDPDCIFPEEGCLYIRGDARARVGMLDERYQCMAYGFVDFVLQARRKGLYTVCSCASYVHQQAPPCATDDAARADAMALLQRWHPIGEAVEQDEVQAVLGHLRREAGEHIPTYRLYREEARGYYHESFSEIRREWNFGRALRGYTRLLPEYLARKAPREGAPRVVFLLNRLQRAGGVLVVADMINDLILAGMDVQLVVHSPRGYDRSIDLLTEPIFFRNRHELIEHFPRADIVVGTFWNTMYAIMKIFVQRRDFTPAYFVQDFEPLFIPERERELRALCEQTYRLTPYCFALTPWIRDRVAEAGGEVALIPPSLDLDVFYPRDVPAAGAKKIILTMLRPRTPRRGFDTAVEVFRRLALHRADFVVHSFGAAPAEMEAHRMGFPAVHHGVVANAELPELYSRAWCFAEFSDFQGFGRTIMESFACGTPAVVTRSGGAEMLCEEGVNSLSAPPRDVDALVAHLNTLLDQPALRQQLASQCRAGVARYERRQSAREVAAYLGRIP